MASIIPSGHSEYLVMPFALMNTPAVFQRFIKEVLRETLNEYAFLYPDDILIYTCLVDKHISQESFVF